MQSRYTNMKLMIASDIHGSAYYCDLIIKRFKESKADKLLIFSTLSYLVLPIDILDVKKLPVIGWFDEIASATIAYKKVCKHITPAMEAEVDAILDRWFPGYTPYELISDEV